MRAGLALMAALALAACNTTEVARVMKGELPPLGGSLEGGPWLLEDLNGGGVLDNARFELNFDPGDQGTSRINGKSGCNRFMGAWKQNGTAVEFGPLAGTMMACTEVLMDAEQKFLKTLEAVRVLSFDPSGAALLKAPDGRYLKIRRAEKPESGSQPVE